MESKIILYTFVLLFINQLFSAQRISGNFSFPAPELKADTVDTSKVNVFYKIDFVKNVENPKKTTSTVALLSIGKEYSRFIDVNQLKADSLNKQYSQLKTVGVKEMKERMKFPVHWKHYALKSFSRSEVVIQRYIKKLYQYEEAIPKMQWKIENDKKEILGHLCRKATAEFRGREYTAWYAEDLVFDNGPFLFGNLPGLILELYDNNEHFHFTAVGINENPLPIYILTPKDLLKTTRDKYRNVEKSYHDNPGFFFSEARDANGEPIKMKSVPYNPIELK